MNDGIDNRRSFRVSEEVYIKYEILTEDEFAEGIERRKLRLGDNDGAQAALVEIETRLGEVGSDGRRRPEPVPGTEEMLPADAVIGQIDNLGDIGDLGLARQFALHRTDAAAAFGHCGPDVRRIRSQGTNTA